MPKVRISVYEFVRKSNKLKKTRKKCENLLRERENLIKVIYGDNKLKTMSQDDEAELRKIKKEILSIVLSCPRGMTLQDLLRDYKLNLGYSIPFTKFGYTTVIEFIKSIPDTVKCQDSRGIQLIIPVVSENVNHINSMIARQKPTVGKRAHNIPRRAMEAEHIRKPFQLPLEAKPVVIDNSYKNNESKRTERSDKGQTTINGFKEYKDYPYEASYNSKTYMIQNDKSSEEHKNIGEQQCKGYFREPIWEKEPIPVGVICEDFDKIIGTEESEEDYDLVESFDTPQDHYNHNDNHCEDNFSYESLGRAQIPELDVRISDKMKSNLRELLQEYPNGLPCSKICTKYTEKYGVKLNYTDYGFSTVKELIIVLPDVFKYKTVLNENSTEWILYDCQQVIEDDDSQKWIPLKLKNNLAKLAASHPNGIKESELLQLYKETFNEIVEFEPFNFSTVSAFIKTCPTVTYRIDQGQLVVFPKITENISKVLNTEMNVLPPPSEMSYLWMSKFAEDECDPSFLYTPFIIPPLAKLNFTKVHVCDALTPNCIWLNLDSSRDELDKLMFELNEFYNENEINFLLDPSTVMKGLVCAVRFQLDGRWHRARVENIKSLSTVEIQYVDYGTVSEVDVTSLRKLFKKFSVLPIQAIESGLHNLTFPSGQVNWDPHTVSLTYQWTIDKKFIVEVIKIENEIPKLEVILHNPDKKGVSINDQLLEEGLVNHVGFISLDDYLKPSFEEEEIQGELYEDITTEAIHTSMMEDLPIEDLRRARIRTPPGYSSKDSNMSIHSALPAANISPEYMKQLQWEMVELQQDFQLKMNEFQQDFQLKMSEFQIKLSELQKRVQEAEQYMRSCSFQSVQEQSILGQAPSCLQPSVDCMPHMYPHQNNVFHPHMGMPLQIRPRSVPNTFMGPANSFGMNPNFGFPSMYYNQSVWNNARPSGFPVHQVMPPRHLPPALMNPPMHTHCKNSGPIGPTSRGGLTNSLSMTNLTSRGPNPPSSVTNPITPGLNPVSTPPSMNVSVSSSSAPQLDTITFSKDMSESAEMLNTVQKVLNTASESSQKLTPSSLSASNKTDNFPPLPTPQEIPTLDLHNALNFEESVEFAESFHSLPQSAENALNRKKSKSQTKLKFNALSNSNWAEQGLNKSDKFFSSPSQLSPTGDTNEKNIHLIKGKEGKLNDLEEILDGESKKLDNAITESIHQQKDDVKSTMKICVAGCKSGADGTAHILLLGDVLGVMVKQLVENYSDLNYKIFISKSKNTLPISHIFYSDYTQLFESLRNEKLITKDDVTIYVVKLKDVSEVLDAISSQDHTDLREAQGIFESVSMDLSVNDVYWSRPDDYTDKV